MDRSTHLDQQYSYGTVSDGNYRQFREALGLPATDEPTGPTLTDLQSDVTNEATDELAEMGQSVRTGLSEPLDATLIADELSALADEFERLPELRRMGTPEREAAAYRELTDAAWRLDEHLTETDFFASAADNLPSFSPEHIEATTRQLLQMESLTDTLREIGLTADEQAALVTNVLNSSEQLSWWEQTKTYPSAEEEGFEDGVDYDVVPPLHKRAMSGALLWIDGLDWHLWQNEVLITDEMIERGVWDVKSMLTGAYLLGDAARSIAEGSISDEDLTTLITASTATMIIGQEYLVRDVVRIDDENRAPRERPQEEV